MGEHGWLCELMMRAGLPVQRQLAHTGAVAQQQANQRLVEENAGNVKRTEGVREAGGGEVDLRGEDANGREIVGGENGVENGEGKQVLRWVAETVALVPQLRQQREKRVGLVGGEEGEQRHTVK